MKISKLWPAALVLLIGCDSALESLRREELWKVQEIHDYQFTYTVSCFCGFLGPNPALITVHNDVVTKVEYVNPLSGSYATAGYPTIDSLFARITRASAEGAKTVKVDYDDAYEFPKSIFIDHDEHTADDEVSFKVENFITLSADQEKE